MRRRVASAILLVAGLPLAAARPAAAVTDPGRTDTVTLSSSFATGYEGRITTYGMSDDGRTVLFVPQAPYFAGDDGSAAAFARDMQGGYRAVVTTSDGRPPDGGIGPAVLSGNGDVVAFVSSATNLDPTASGVTGSNAYVVRLSGGPVRLVSRLPGTTTAANAVGLPLVVTPDGRYVVFAARAPRLDPGPPGDGQQLYRYDVLTEALTAVTLADDGVHLAAGDSGDASIIADGRYVAFTSSSSDLVSPHLTAEGRDVYLRDLTVGTTTLISHAATSATQRTGMASEAVISAGGGTVVYLSSRSHSLTGGASSLATQVMAWDRATGVNRLVSRSATGSGPANSASITPKVSGDGAVIAFLTHATDLVAGVTDANTPAPGSLPAISYVSTDAYAEVGGSLRLLSHAEGDPNRTASAGVDRLALSRGGGRAAFSTLATDLVGGLSDAGTGADVYAADTTTGAVRAASLEKQSSTLLSGENVAEHITPDGSQLAFTQDLPLRIPSSLSLRRSFGPVLPPIPPVPGDVGTNPPPTPPPVLLHPVSPRRILDSRPSGPRVGPYATPWSAGTTRNVTVAGENGIPADASAVVLNVTATSTSASSYLTVWPTGQPRPVASSQNWAAGQTVPNAVTTKVGTAGQVSVFNAAGTADVVFDVVGYYDSAGGDGFTPLAPSRILDSRQPGSSPWAAGQARDVPVAGVGRVPADADAVLVNATVTGPSSSGFLTVWPAGAARPHASSLNWAAGETVANAVTAKVGAGGAVSVFNASGTAHVIFDVVGYFAAGKGAPFHPITPVRIQDSRPGSQVGPSGSPLGPGETRGVGLIGSGGIPEAATAVLMNVTATNTSAASHMTVWPDGQAMPPTSTLNWAAGRTRANAATSQVGSFDGISVRNAAGTVDLVLDVAGWYG